MIEIKPVDAHNIWKLVALSVDEAQQEFVAINTQSLLQAYTTVISGHVALPFGVFLDGEAIGFMMFGYGKLDDEGEPEIAAGNYCLWRFMIDKTRQGRGYGREALKAGIEYIGTLPCGPADCLWTSYDPRNLHARALYLSMGFSENGQVCDDETVAAMPL